jgi:hypothetical protein
LAQKQSVCDAVGPLTGAGHSELPRTLDEGECAFDGVCLW